MEKYIESNNSHVVFIGGLWGLITMKQLSEYFSKYGDDVTVQFIINKKKKKSKRCAFVNCPNKTIYNRILTDSHVINKKEIRCSKIFPKEEHAENEIQKEKRIFVNNLPLFFTSDMLFRYFSKYGKILKAYIVSRNKRKKPFKIGYVTTYDVQTSKHILSIKNHWVEDNLIVWESYKNRWYPTPEDSMTSTPDQDPKIEKITKVDPPTDPAIKITQINKRRKKKPASVKKDKTYEICQKIEKNEISDTGGNYNFYDSYFDNCECDVCDGGDHICGLSDLEWSDNYNNMRHQRMDYRVNDADRRVNVIEKYKGFEDENSLFDSKKKLEESWVFFEGIMSSNQAWQKDANNHYNSYKTSSRDDYRVDHLTHDYLHHNIFESRVDKDFQSICDNLERVSDIHWENMDSKNGEYMNQIDQISRNINENLDVNAEIKNNYPYRSIQKSNHFYQNSNYSEKITVQRLLKEDSNEKSCPVLINDINSLNILKINLDAEEKINQEENLLGGKLHYDTLKQQVLKDTSLSQKQDKVSRIERSSFNASNYIDNNYVLSSNKIRRNVEGSNNFKDQRVPLENSTLPFKSDKVDFIIHEASQHSDPHLIGGRERGKNKCQIYMENSSNSRNSSISKRVMNNKNKKPKIWKIVNIEKYDFFRLQNVINNRDGLLLNNNKRPKDPIINFHKSLSVVNNNDVNNIETRLLNVNANNRRNNTSNESEHWVQLVVSHWEFPRDYSLGEEELNLRFNKIIKY